MLPSAQTLLDRPYQPHHLSHIGELTVMAFFMRPGGDMAVVLPRLGALRQFQAVQGRVRPGELPYDAGLREIKEEIGMAPRRFSYDPSVSLGVYHSKLKNKVVLGLFYFCDRPVATPRLNPQEVKEFRWVGNYYALPNLMRDCSADKTAMTIMFLSAAAERVHDFKSRWGNPPVGWSQPERH